MLPNTAPIRRVVLLVTLAILVMQGIATWHITERARESQQAAAEESVRRIARGMEASVNRAFVQVDAMLAGLPSILSAFHGPGGLDTAAVNRVLRELTNQTFTYRDIVLIGPDGAPLAAAQPLSRRRRLPFAIEGGFVDVGARGGAISVAGPVANPTTAEWSLYFARTITVRGMGPVMAVTEVPLHQIRALLADGADGPGIQLTLEHENGAMLASAPHDEVQIGQLMHPSASSLAADRNPISTRSRFNDRPVIFLARPTLYQALFVSASLDREVALAGWVRDRSRALTLSGGLAVVLLTMAFTLIMLLRNRDRVEAARANARRMVEDAIESMNDGFIMFDAEDRLVTCNRRYRELLNLTEEDATPGTSFPDLLRAGATLGRLVVDGKDLEAWLEERIAWHLGDNPPMELALPDGRWLMITDRRTPDGGTVGIRTDITPMKLAMAALSAARDEAAEAAAAKGRFLARMSHELRTPLNGVLGFAQVLLIDPRLSSDQRQQVRTMHEAGSHLLEMVNSLLDISKIDAGRLDLDIRETGLREVLEGCAALVRPEIERKAIRFAIEAASELPSTVLIDATRLRQLVLNLLSNAVKFAPARGRVTLRALSNPDGGLRLEVEDNGPGVPEDKRHLLFEDFVQLASATPGGAMGTGLGLAISARLAKLMGGRIGCGGESGQGAVFWVELPLVAVQASHAVKAQAQPVETAEDRPRVALHLLVVDDIKANRDVARAILEGAGHRVTVVADGEAAIAAVRHDRFDAVLMDVHMPGMDGLEATRRIRALPAPLGQVTILALSASVQAEQVAACRAAGMDGHLDKPIDRERMLATLAQLARDRPAPEATMAETMTDTVPLLDTKRIEALRAQLGAAAADIIQEFIGELRRAGGLLADASPAERGDPARVKALAHRLLGGARTLGAVALEAEAEALQRAAKDGDAAPALQARALMAVDAALGALEAAEARRSGVIDRAA